MVKQQQKRKQWRKAKIDDVEEALEDDRAVTKLKMRTPGSKKNTDDNLELFTIDTEGTGEGLSNASKRALARAKIFPPKAPRIGLTAMEEAKVERANGALAAAKAPKKKAAPEVFDMWAAAPEVPKKQPEPLCGVARVREIPSKKASKMPGTLHQKVSDAPAVLPAHEGQSMNPETKAFQDLAFQAAAQQLAAEREAEVLDRKMLPVTNQLKEAKGEEAVEGMDEAARIAAYRELTCPRAVAAEAEGGGLENVVPRTKKMVRKSQAQKNRDAKRANLDAKKEQKKTQKKLEKSVGEVGAILKDMADRDEFLKQRKAYRESMRDKRKRLETTEGVVPKTRRLGKTIFEETAIQLPDAAASSKGLRSMPLSGASAVQDRVSSIMRRGLLPAPPQVNAGELMKNKNRAHRASKKRKMLSPLMRDNQISKR